MGWGGARPGSGRKKPAPNGKRVNVPATRVKAVKVDPAPTVPAEPKALDPRTWAMMLPEIEEISRRYAVNKSRHDTPQLSPFQLPKFPREALPKDPKLAMDSNEAIVASLGFGNAGWLAESAIGGLSGEGLLFLGYTYLSELAQRPEYRVMSETIADDATRKWIEFDVVGDEEEQAEERKKDPEGYDERLADPDERKKRVDRAGKTDRVKELEDDQLRLEVRLRYYEQARNGGFFGRTHLFHDIRTADTDEINPDELKQSIGDSRDATSLTKCPVGAFKGLRTIEPVWTYPLMYNAINPLRADWYNPQVWFVMGQEIHGSRLATFIPHPVPDMLKPAYAFGGLSLSQMAKPYVDRWLTTVTSVNQLIHSFSVMVLATDLQTTLSNGAGGLMARVALFNMLRDNQGAFVINKATEDFKNVSASLAGLHELQAQSQEHMAAILRIPLVKFTGIQPAGLNACLPGDTLILTDRGEVPIRDVTLSDLVMTRGGWAPLTFSGVTKYATELIEIQTESTVLKCTANHPIWLSSTNEFVRAENVRPGDHLLLIGEKSATPNMPHPWHGAGNGGGDARTDITSLGMLSRNGLSTCIAECGKCIADQFRQASISTTLTARKGIIRSPILRRCMAPFMPNFTALNAAFALAAPRDLNPSTARTARKSFSSPNFQAKRSFVAEPASSRIDGQIAYRRQNRHRFVFASLAERLSLQFARMLSFVRGSVRPRAKTARNICGDIIGRILKNMSELRSKTPNVTSDVGRVVSVRIIWASEPVYDLTVAAGHLPEFFANGILTHNSSEGEIEVYDDTIGAYQMRVLDPNLRRTINFEMLSLWGEIDKEITHRWTQLRPMTQKERGEKEKDDADRDQKYVDMGAISPAEVRKRVINDKDLPYTGLNADDVPPPPAEEGLLGPGAGGAAKVEAEAAEGVTDPGGET